MTGSQHDRTLKKKTDLANDAIRFLVGEPPVPLVCDAWHAAAVSRTIPRKKRFMQRLRFGVDAQWR